MKLFDLHADIGYDVMQKKRVGQLHVVDSIHKDKFKKGELGYVGMASFFEGKEDWAYMQEMIINLKAQIQECEELDLVMKKQDLFQETGHCKAILTVEGMCGITKDPIAKIEWLHQMGVRIASLCWNDENALATGVRGTANRGISDMGKAVIRKMMDLHMIIDVSHANEKTFWDIMELHPSLVIATHSNLRTLCDHPRNLWAKQALAIKEQGGVIGVVAAPTFVSEKKEERDLAHLIGQVKALVELVGIDHVATGFDFMDFYDDYEEVIDGFEDCTKAQAFVKGLEAAGFSTTQIQKICYENALRVVAQAFPCL